MRRRKLLSVLGAATIFPGCSSTKDTVKVKRITIINYTNSKKTANIEVFYNGESIDKKRFELSKDDTKNNPQSSVILGKNLPKKQGRYVIKYSFDKQKTKSINIAQHVSGECTIVEINIRKADTTNVLFTDNCN